MTPLALGSPGEGLPLTTSVSESSFAGHSRRSPSMRTLLVPSVTASSERLASARPVKAAAARQITAPHSVRRKDRTPAVPVMTLFMVSISLPFCLEVPPLLGFQLGERLGELVLFRCRAAHVRRFHAHRLRRGRRGRQPHLPLEREQVFVLPRGLFELVE